MNNNETLKDIVAEMRDFRYHETRLKMADRIEAAWKLESKELRLEAASAKEDRNRVAVRMRYEFAAKCKECKSGNSAALREALELCMRYMCEYCRKEAAFSMPGKQCVDGCETLRIAKAALAAPARNCDLIANELSIDPERVPGALNKCENAPIRELIRWIFAKAEPKGGAECSK